MSDTDTLPQVAATDTTDTLNVIIRQLRLESEGVLSLELNSHTGDPLPAWEPGAHIDVALGPGLLRQYSLCGDPADRGSYRIAVLREPASRGGSLRIHESLRPGQSLQISQPRNNFRLSESTKPLILIAGGIGITPILAMAREAQARGRDFTLHYGGRSRNNMAFLAELSQFTGRVHLTSDDTEGPLDLDHILRAAHTGEQEVYVCGPGGLLDEVERRSADWPAGVFHCERFVPKVFETPAEGEKEFLVACSQSGLTVTIPPNLSILESLENAGLNVPNSCREGTCGSCETDILAGVPDHRDSLLSAEEQESGETMLICVSRCRTDLLELDL